MVGWCVPIFIPNTPSTTGLSSLLSICWVQSWNTWLLYSPSNIPVNNCLEVCFEAVHRHHPPLPSTVRPLVRSQSTSPNIIRRLIIKRHHQGYHQATGRHSAVHRYPPPPPPSPSLPLPPPHPPLQDRSVQWKSVWANLNTGRGNGIVDFRATRPWAAPSLSLFAEFCWVVFPLSSVFPRVVSAEF